MRRENFGEQLKARLKVASLDKTGAALQHEVIYMECEVGIILRTGLVEAFKVLAQHTEQTGVSHAEFIANCLNSLRRSCDDLINEFGVEEHD